MCNSKHKLDHTTQGERAIETKKKLVQHKIFITLPNLMRRLFSADFSINKVVLHSLRVFSRTMRKMQEKGNLISNHFVSCCELK